MRSNFEEGNSLNKNFHEQHINNNMQIEFNSTTTYKELQIAENAGEIQDYKKSAIFKKLQK